jgi:large subunit ribosomal protein L6
MSRIGKKPVLIPSGINVKTDGSKISFSNSKVTEELETKNNVLFKVEGNELIFSPKDETKQSSAFWGTYRSLAQNIITGLTQGFKKELEINGVGYRANVKGNVLELQLGFSHPINFEIPKGLSIAVNKNLITITGVNKQQVGQVAAEIRGFRPPEPYKGKGVKYVDEHIIRKAGKTGK